jgi:hypothetical protein
MDIFKKFDFKTFSTWQIVALVAIGLVLVVIGLNIIGSTLRNFTMNGGWPTPSAIAPSMPSMGYGGGYGGSGNGASYDYAVSSDYYDYGKGVAQAMPEMSARNVAVSRPPTYYGGTTGDEAEEYEVAQYNATIETRKLKSTCAAFEELKKRSDVIFENSNTGDRNCSFTFKVKHASVEGVLTWLKDLRPKDLSENTYTIKNQVDDFTSETEILTKKRASIDDTLTKALTAYDEITRLATNTQNADALAKIIDSKIQIIERLTQERINIDEQLDRIARGKSQQLDQLDYTYFYVHVFENRFVDPEQIHDSWKEAIRNFVNDVNKILQDFTINLVSLLLIVALWCLYALIALFIAKYGWKLVKHIWNK